MKASKHCLDRAALFGGSSTKISRARARGRTGHHRLLDDLHGLNFEPGDVRSVLKPLGGSFLEEGHFRRGHFLSDSRKENIGRSIDRNHLCSKGGGQR